MASEERRGSNALSWKPNEMGLGDDDDDDDFMKSRTSQHSNLDQFESRIVGRSHSSVCSSYIDAEWSELRRSVAQVLIKPMFDVVICFIILLQFSMVVWETNVRAAEGPDSVPMVILVCEKLFLMIFIIEVGCRAFAFRMQVLRNSWSMFEVILVVLDLISELLAFALGRIPSITALRIVKILRIGRFGKVIRLLPIFRELYMMLHGFVSSMRAIMWATILLFFMLTVWSVLAVEILHPVNQEVAADGLYDGCDRCARAFESAQASVVTFIQHIVAGDSWGLVSIPIMEKQPWTSVIFMSVFISVDLGLLNLILTVIVDRAAQARQEDKRFLLQQREHEFQAFLITSWIKFLIADELDQAMADPTGVHSVGQMWIFGGVALLFFVFGAVFTVLGHKLGSPQWTGIASTVACTVAAMCLLDVFLWRIMPQFPTKPMMGHLTVAFQLSMLAILMILLLAAVQSVTGDVSARALRGAFTGIALCVGSSWEKTFDASVDALDVFDYTEAQKALITTLLVVIVFPAWMVYMLPKSDAELKKEITRSPPVWAICCDHNPCDEDEDIEDYEDYEEESDEALE